ncbi:MAG: hypothetical protein ACXADB_10220 [Candidatus Hermodarchaeia archaeon]|jgi:hypothetical protein
MNNFGIIVPHLGSSQVTYEAIKLVNSMDTAVLFFEQIMVPCVPIKCATMCITEVMNFGGTLVTTSIENTRMVNKIANRKQIKLIFYAWDLEWLRPGKQVYSYNYETYHMPDVLAVRSEEHVGPLENYCNRRPVALDFSKVITC